MRTIPLLLLLAVGCATSTAPSQTPAAPELSTKGEPSTKAADAHAGSEAAARDDATWKYFGEPFTVASAVPAATVLAAPQDHASGPVRVTGELAEVCQKMGCWAVVRDDQGNSVRITMKDHAFGIDKDAAGRACDVEGVLVSTKVDPATLEHYASEGATEHPEAGKDVAWSLVASSVAVARESGSVPH